MNARERPDVAGRPHVAPGSAETNVNFLPDFCQPRMVLAVVLIAELLAVSFALVRASDHPFLYDLARLSLFVQWLGLTGAGLLCAARPRLNGLSVPAASAAVFVLLIVNTAVFAGLALWLGRVTALGGQGLFPTETWPFLLRTEAICIIVTALLLRYFFVSHQWSRNVRAEARSRVHALQARMRPHFLFNSMNTIAALTRSDPARAEEAVEDLADLFRASLGDSDRPLHVKEELELTRIYQRIEELRLGDRLKVVWDVADLPLRARMPGLTIQPLLENAIYHGIEPLPEGGTVTISGRVEGGRLIITLRNPVAADVAARPGNRHALDNVRERLRLVYTGRGALETAHGDGEYVVTLSLPIES